jgi:uncharacterized protein (TIGR00251 family)
MERLQLMTPLEQAVLKHIQEHKHLNIVVKTNQPKTQIVSFLDNTAQLQVKAEPKENKANEEIIKFFKKLTKQTPTIKGATSKKKLIRFD